MKGKREGTVGAGTKDDRVWGVRRRIVGKGGGGKGEVGNPATSVRDIPVNSPA